MIAHNTIFRRVAGDHPRWHAVATVDARSRPDALRRLGYDPAPRQNALLAVPLHGEVEREGGSAQLAYIMVWRTDRIDFDHRALDGTVRYRSQEREHPAV